MSQHDMTVDNGPGLTFRNDMNAALQALASQSSGASAPSPTFPCQVWADTGTGRLKRRNAANSAWLDEGPLDALLRDAASAGAYASDTGAANAFVCNFTPAFTARSEGTPIRFKVANANTGACTINDGVGTVALVGANHAALLGGETFANGIAWIQWNTSVGGGSYVLLFCTGAAAPVSVVGATRNVKMSVTAASASATLTADEVVLKFALGAQSWLLQSFSKTINLATTGAGGMDTGAAPVNGFVAIYAIYNPSTATSALLAVNATAAAALEIYGGANMPSGYTASALLTVVPTNASSQFLPVIVIDRYVGGVIRVVLSTTSTQGSLTSLSIASDVLTGLPAAPKNTRQAYGYALLQSTTTTSVVSSFIGGSSTSIGQMVMSGIGISSSTFIVPVITSQSIFYSSSNVSGTFNHTIVINGYSI